MDIQDFLLLLVFVNFFLGFFVFLQNLTAKRNIYFSLFCLGSALWIFGIYLIDETHTFYWPDKVSLFGALLTTTSFYLFSRTFPLAKPVGADTLDAKEISQGIFNDLRVALALPVILLLLLPFNLIIRDINFSGHSALPVNGPLFPVFMLSQLLYCALIFRNLYLRLKNSFGYWRQQTLYVFLGLSIYFGTSIIFDLVLPAFGHPQLNLVGPVASSIFILLCAVSIVSHRLLDIRILLRNTVIFSGSAAAAAAAFIAFREWRELHRGFHQSFGAIRVIWVFITFFAAQLLLNTIYDRIFLKQYRLFIAKLSELNEKLGVNLYPRELIFEVIKSLRQGLNLKWIFYYESTQFQRVFGPHQLSDAAQQAALIPDEVLQRIANGLTKPVFFDGNELDLPPEKKIHPLAALPIIEDGKLQGYFLLGPQRAFAGLSNEQINMLWQSWTHMQTAYARASLNAGLEQTVKAQVHNIEYKNKKLKEMMESRIEFVEAASHQLRTPLTVLSGSLELLNSQNVDPDQKSELIRMAYEKTKVLSKLVTGILSMAKIEHALEGEFSESADLNAIMTNIRAVLEPQALDKKLSFTAQVEHAAKVYGSKVYLEQAFFNIIENAVQHTKGGGISISYIIEPDYVITRIEDTGSGIDEEYRANIFKKHIKTKYSSGLGLGLYLAEKIVSAHPKGHIWFESNQNGTIFFVRLKRSQQSQP